MLNTSLSDIVFNCTEKDLDIAVRSEFRKTAYGLLELQNLTEEHLPKISTKTNMELLYSKFVLEKILTNTAAVFDETYVISAYDLYQNRRRDDAKSLVYRFLASNESEIEYRLTYEQWLPRGIGPFLIALHSTGVLTLPMSFNWPRPSGKHGEKSIDIGKVFASEIVSFIRCLESQTDDIPDLAFVAVGTARVRRQWFSCYGTKLILATGWRTFRDVNVDDLVKLSAAVESNGTSKNITYPFTLLVDILWRKYGDGISVTPESYDHATKTSRLTERASSRRLSYASDDASQLATLESVMLHNASNASPEALRARDALPGLAVDFRAISKLWLDIEETYLRNLKRESRRSPVTAIGWLNVYLFLYLPYWFAAHPESGLEFPDCPQKLLSGVFVTRLIDLDVRLPLFSGLLSRPIMRFSCPAAGPRSSVVQTPLG